MICFAGRCKRFVEFFFIDTTPFVDKYWGPEQKRTFDWRGIGPRQEYLDASLKVCTQLLNYSVLISLPWFNCQAFVRVRQILRAINSNASLLHVRQNLSRALESSEATWKIVVGHHTIRSLGRHGDTPELVQQVLPILEVSLSIINFSLLPLLD